MNESDSVDPKPGEPLDLPVPAETAEKPKRRRVARKLAAVEAPDDASHPSADPVAAEAPVAEAPAVPGDEPADAPKAKPVRRRRKVVAADGETAAEPSGAAPASTEVAAAVERPAAEPEGAREPVADSVGAGAGAGTPAGADEPGPSAADAGPMATPSSPESAPDEPARADDQGAEDRPDGDGLAPREGSRRRRNRRRNRDRNRAGTEGAADRAVAGAVDGAVQGAVDGAASPAGPGEDMGLREPLPPTDPAELFAEVLSGAFDQDAPMAPAAAEGPVEPPKRVLAPEPDAPKLHKVLAQAGVGSRRDMEQWVLEGRVTVNGEPAHTGQRISFGDRIAVDGKPVRVRIAPPPPRVLAYHKPAGEVVTHGDPQHRPTVFRRLPRLPHGKWQSVGRLDLNTEGLLLFTNSGELANQLMHPRFGVEREYAVRSLGVLDDEQRQRLLEGVEIDGQRAAFKSVEDGGGEGVNHWYRVVITEGRNREVRRLFEAVGHAVSRLIRIRYGCVVLPRGLKRGVWVDLPEFDVKALRQLTGTDRDRPRDAEGPAGARSKRGRRGGRNRDGGRPREGGREPGFDRPLRAERSDDAGGDHEAPMHIPNPLQQTYDKRFIQQARSAPRRELSEDDPIPNPLQQTYDRRALQRDRQMPRDMPDDGPIPNPLQQTYDKRFVGKGGSPGPRGARGGRGGAAGGGRQPDPMQTSVGYIGADALQRKRAKGGRGGRKPGGGGSGGGRGPGGGGGGRGR